MNFEDLLPNTICDAVASQGYSPTGALFPLNSYENRVYEIPLDEGEPIIAKFYRPGRWSAEAIGDEQNFIASLADFEIPVVPSLKLPHPLAAIPTVAEAASFYYTITPKFRGRARDELSNDDRKWLGRMIARMHNAGEHLQTPHRLALTPQTYGYDSVKFILNQPFIADDLKRSVEFCLNQALTTLTPLFTPDLKTFPIHGDCHMGNILWNNDGPHFVDFDDMVIGPPVQDVWMLFHGTAEEQKTQRDAFFEGYELFRKFDYGSLRLAEPLRTLRMIRHAAWIGQRYDDPAFQRAFPYYTQNRYWEEFLLAIKEQIGAMQDALA
ncbi:MAG: serine/threonine protein kinase [Deltaproteobacteria bacterium CG11_big_fil_rev_8_21_14_0_20_47_16]|nr:MAG: serine/threonine protein kinase [Deltaproteobacteria bacterium CG11_big_fil_rev_8_21_14_0_20_47_16]